MGFPVKIDKFSCQSSGRCVGVAPKAFAFDEDHLAEPLEAASALPREKLIRIAKNCPGLAITVYDENGDEIDLES